MTALSTHSLDKTSYGLKHMLGYIKDNAVHNFSVPPGIPTLSNIIKHHQTPNIHTQIHTTPSTNLPVVTLTNIHQIHTTPSINLPVVTLTKIDQIHTLHNAWCVEMKCRCMSECTLHLYRISSDQPSPFLAPLHTHTTHSCAINRTSRSVSPWVLNVVDHIRFFLTYAHVLTPTFKPQMTVVLSVYNIVSLHI